MTVAADLRERAVPCWRRAFDRGVRYLLGDDVFISYARADADIYALALARALQEGGQRSCFLDQYGSDPGATVPRSVLQRVRRCAVFVVVVTPAAARSPNVGREVEERMSTGAGAIQVVDAGGALAEAVWADTLRGIHLVHELPDAMGVGTPAQEVVNRLALAVGYHTRARRTGRITAAALALGALSIVSATTAVAIQVRASTATAAAIEDKVVANEAAAEARRRADAADTDRRSAEVRATTFGRAADEAREQAASSRADAEAAAREEIAAWRDLGEARHELEGVTLDLQAAREEARGLEKAIEGSTRQLAQGHAQKALLHAGRFGEELVAAHEGLVGFGVIGARDPLADAGIAAAAFSAARAVHLRGTGSPLTSLAYSNGGDLIAAGDESGRVHLWRARTGEPLTTLADPSLAVVKSVVFSPDDSRVLATFLDGSVRAWDVSGGRSVRLPEGSATPGAAAWAGDAARILTSSPLGVRSWSARTGQLLDVLERLPSATNGSVFSRDGQLLAAMSAEGDLAIWDVATERRRVFLEHDPPWQGHHPAHLERAAFSDDGGRLFAQTTFGAASVWDVAKGKLVRRWSRSFDEVRSVAFAPDGSRLAVTTTARGVVLVRVDDGEELARRLEQVSQIAVFSPDGERVVADAGGDAVAFDAWQLHLLRTLPGMLGGADWFPLPDNHFAVSADLHVLAVTDDKRVTILDPISGAVIRDGRDEPCCVFRTLVSDGGEIVAADGGVGRAIRTWEGRTGHALARIPVGDIEPVFALAPDGRYLLVAEAEGPSVYDSRTGARVAAVSCPVGRPRAASFVAGSVAEIEGDGVFRLDIGAGTCTAQDRAAEPGDDLIVRSADGIATAKGDEIMIAARGVRRTVGPASAAVKALAYVAGGTLLVTGGADGEIELWDVESGALLDRVDAGTGEIDNISVASDGRHLLTVGEDRVFRVWGAPWPLPATSEERRAFVCGVLRWQPDWNDVADHCLEAAR